jgi:3-deoxy-D-arabino-heptulosonate 7-phosphate (DAHP) synthase
MSTNVLIATGIDGLVTAVITLPVLMEITGLRMNRDDFLAAAAAAAAAASANCMILFDPVNDPVNGGDGRRGVRDRDNA